MTATPARHASRRLAMWALLLLLIAAVIEGGAFVVVRLVLTPNAGFLLWQPDLDAVRRSWVDAAKVDDELGWPSPAEAFAPPRDATGAKVNPDFPADARACASIYGDSFVWGDDVALADGWVEQLSRKLGCRVANFGVSGYGTDQAFLRFRRVTTDAAPVALLGIFPENVMRNVNQYRAFIGFAPHPSWLKGRFVLDPPGRLQWIARPQLDLDAFVALHRAPATVLPREYLLPDTRDGPVTVRFPYALTLARVALMPRVRVRLTGRPSWGDFFTPDHPSGALQLTAAIAEAFVREAERRGRRALVIMLPGASSLRAHATFGAFEYAPLVAMLTARGVDVFDPGPGLLAATAGRDYCALYAAPATCAGHFGLAGSTLMAELVAAELRRRALTGP